MNSTRASALRMLLAALTAAAVAVAAGPASGQDKATTYAGKAVRIGNGSAHTVVRTDAAGTPVAIGVVFTASALEGLPKAAKGANPNFAYVLGMPGKGPKTIVDHVVVNWESAGHPPPKVYDVPHFDFHFYQVSRAQRSKVKFSSESESADPRQQPPAELLPPGYVVPPGTAVSGMGVHAIDPGWPEFHGQPFTATFIYGYYNKQLTFIEPMASLAFLQSKPKFSAALARPANYSKAGAYPSTYGIKYDEPSKSYEVTLTDLR
jgi:hypothetical protein